MLRIVAVVKRVVPRPITVHLPLATCHFAPGVGQDADHDRKTEIVAGWDYLWVEVECLSVYVCVCVQLKD